GAGGGAVAGHAGRDGHVQHPVDPAVPQGPRNARRGGAARRRPPRQGGGPLLRRTGVVRQRPPGSPQPGHALLSDRTAPTPVLLHRGLPCRSLSPPTASPTRTSWPTRIPSFTRCAARTPSTGRTPSRPGSSRATTTSAPPSASRG